jgi:fucose permease
MTTPDTQTLPAPKTATPTAARFATKTHFFVSGLLFATWGVHVPTVRSAYHLNEAELSWLMLAAGVGALIALTQVGKWVATHAARPVAIVGAFAVAAPLFFLLMAPGYGVLLALLFCFGFGSGAFDVSINAEAVAVEQAYGRPIMSSFHGFFSLGGMIGAGIGSLTAATDISPMQHLVGMSSVCFIAVLVASRYMLPDEATHSPEHANTGFKIPSAPILLLGLLAAFGLLGEGAMYDWSTLYMAKELGSPQAVAALAYGAFSAAMAAARFGGDWVRAKLGPERTLQRSSWLAAVSMTIALLIGEPWAALLGFALVGIGFANMVPVLFSSAARVPGVTPAQGIAGVSSCGYLGFMIGPPLIGAIATGFGLDRGLLVVAVFAALVALLTHRAMRGASA